MGFNFRKTINLGNGFKINLSKSGIGYSFGVPGVRYSQSATGKKKMTYSIPGTGISYSNDISSKKRKTKQKADKQPKSQIEEQVCNIEWADNSSSDEFINAINDFRKKDNLIIAFIIICSILLSLLIMTPIFIIAGLIIFGAYLVYRNNSLMINIEYDFDETNAQYYELMQCFFNEIASTNKLWLIDTKYNNTGNNAVRTPATITKKVPYYIKTNISCSCLTIGDKEIYFLPNKVLLNARHKTSGVDFSELKFEFGETPFAEQGNLPNDCEVSGHTWLYLNKNGEPNKRYKNNPRLPKCLYGTINIKSDTGLNLTLLLSSKKRTEQAKEYYEKMCNLSIRETKRCINCNEEISVDANFCKHCGAKQE